MKKMLPLLLLIAACKMLQAQTEQPFGPIPSARQLKWHELEYYLFTHFGPNTFTDLEWGKGTESEDMFNPTALDCNQWCRIAKAAGAKGIIITAKHHDGFCLWPSKYSSHTVAQSKWRGGKGDVLQELSNACKKYNLKLGIYLSPWDRNHPKYGTDEYNDIFVKMMEEVVARYGPLFEFWWDGANGEGPNGKRQVYDWNRFEATMRRIAPNTPVFSDIGPDIRWVGNERGFAGVTNWNLLDTAGFTRGEGSPATDTLNSGNMYGKHWIPAECDVSIRPGWFYHTNEDEKVKTPEQLFDLYLKSVGRGATLLLNVPPDRRGLITGYDSAALVGFKKLRDESFGKKLASKAFITDFNRVSRQPAKQVVDDNRNTFTGIENIAQQKLLVSFTNREHLNCIVLQEPVQMGQRIISYSIIFYTGNESVQEYHGTTIGNKRIITFPEVGCDSFSLEVHKSKAKPLISELAAYLINNGLVEK